MTTRGTNYKTGTYASGFRGVSRQPTAVNFPWRARIGGGAGSKGKFIELGRFATPEAAARAYDAAARRRYGDKATLNFPDAPKIIEEALMKPMPVHHSQTHGSAHETVTLWLKDPIRAQLHELAVTQGISRAEAGRRALSAGLPLALNPPAAPDAPTKTLSPELQNKLAMFALLNITIQRAPDGVIARIIAPEMATLLADFSGAESELSEFLETA